MSVYFLDSSALVKRYATERGTPWVQALTDPIAGHELIIARITQVETLAALTKRCRMGNVSSGSLDAAIRAFEEDLDSQYAVVELSEAVALLAGQLVRRHPLRGYDAVQLASAMILHQELASLAAPLATFLSADQHLVVCARAEGLLADDPNAHQ